jgi:hypothetical protein
MVITFIPVLEQSFVLVDEARNFVFRKALDPG